MNEEVVVRGKVAAIIDANSAAASFVLPRPLTPNSKHRIAQEKARV